MKVRQGVFNIFFCIYKAYSYFRILSIVKTRSPVSEGRTSCCPRYAHPRLQRILKRIPGVLERASLLHQLRPKVQVQRTICTLTEREYEDN